MLRFREILNAPISFFSIQLKNSTLLHICYYDFFDKFILIFFNFITSLPFPSFFLSFFLNLSIENLIILNISKIKAIVLLNNQKVKVKI